MSEKAAGFETTEPRSGAIALVGAGIVILLVLVIVGVEAYYDRVRDQQIFVKQLQPVSEDLKALRAREDTDLNSYRYIDRAKGSVRLPINRAMDLLVEEAHAKR
ncbi:MAG TPA: hypothetical protein VN893_12115 [Bryobacteraceae bacterium]|nr:hypothetical protein [Bryobacteraceae bacterium]